MELRFDGLEFSVFSSIRNVHHDELFSSSLGSIDKRKRKKKERKVEILLSGYSVLRIVDIFSSGS